MAGAFKATEIVALPAMNGDRDVAETLESGLRIDAEVGVEFLRFGIHGKGLDERGGGKSDLILWGPCWEPSYVSTRCCCYCYRRPLGWHGDYLLQRGSKSLERPPQGQETFLRCGFLALLRIVLIAR